ncbi:Molybdopterin or thiamine biosynthesis adenylyltransferase [Aliiroseovarius halocynthiae]|uniref:HesA/MoeB/ThiF family protein n=1 Tax=Aliiroseovarius halocynthiae TaxID=985055 RepID=A0A545SX26_9RHOB|nr:HesA/MoeB/ThiF family protein [Aliiroseovarius halocynthiae]TQV69515.1 HesA/MoeB/ThiF family protein [Aliiroseovarius halocynthiae]SMR70850.1 Molybdopterin or thiamine biosynthesis adenylyltransferase [Aliiroseovarius halocynthiae]
MSRYARQIILPEVGADRQTRLAQARVLVIGAGGLAAPCLPLLAGAGIGHLTIVDGDTVALSNLHRQTLFTEADCGLPKAQAAASRCRAINSVITIEALDCKLTPANAPDLVTHSDLVVDCADNYAVSYLLSDICISQDTPLISASALGLGGYVGGFCGGAPSLRAVFPDAPGNDASCETAGVLGPVVGIIGAMQAQMALNILLGLTPSPLGQLVQFDAQSLRSASFRFDKATEPDRPFRFVAASELTDTDLIIELRQDAPVLHPLARRISLEQLAQNLPTLDTRLALCCATGLRAWRAAEEITQKWPGEIVLVAASAS